MWLEFRRVLFRSRLERGIDQYKRGNGGKPQLSPTIEDIARHAWVLSSINYNLSRVRSGILFAACLSDRNLRHQLLDSCPELKDISTEDLLDELPEIISDSPEHREVFSDDSTATRDFSGGEPAAGGATPSLDKFTVDMTADARAGKIDPVLGRDPEIRQIIDILTRRRQNNPILTGEAGVGKTAVVEGFALRIATGDVPPVLKNVSLRSLDLGLLQAGAGVKGEFENRLKQVIQEVGSSPQPIILFIDEAHTLIGAGGQEGQNDAANLLKPALARGELRTVAATTWAEYKRYFEKDPALTRRFQVVKIEEPEEDVAIKIMRSVAVKLEQHHRVRILDDAVRESVRLSHRYIPARQLPDKSVSVLDTACARVGIGRNATPAAVEDLRRSIDACEVEINILEREAALGSDHTERLAAVADENKSLTAALEKAESRWKAELALVETIIDLRGKIEAARSPQADDEESADGDDAPTEADIPGLRKKLDTERNKLHKMQGEDP